MVAIWPILCAILIQGAPTAAPPTGEIPVLVPGVEVEGVIADGDPVVATETLLANYREAPTVGRGHVLRVDATGPVTVDLHSLDFDAYLVLRDRGGEVVAEDDDGYYATHARLVIPELRAGEEYRVEACALHGARGSYRLRVAAGAEPALDAVARVERGIDDLRERALRAERALGAESAELAELLDAWAESLRQAGRVMEALPICERALAIREKALGPEDPETLTSMNNKALMLYELGRYEESRVLNERTLQLREVLLGPDHMHTSTSLNNLALVLSAMGRFEEARVRYERALRIDEEKAGPEHIRTAESLVNLGSTLMQLGKFEESRERLERASRIAEKDPARSVMLLIPIACALGDISISQGRYEDGDRHYEKALRLCESALGAEHPHTGVLHSVLAMLRYEQGDFAEARTHSERSLAILRPTLGADHPRTITALNMLANTARAQGRYEESRRLLDLVHESSVRAFGPDSENAGAALNNIAGLLKEQGRLEEAYPLYVRACEIAEELPDPLRRAEMRGLNNLAHILDQLGRFDEARVIHEQSLALRRELLGPDHPEIAMALSNLAMNSMNRGRYEEARPHLEQAISILASAPESHRLDLAICSQNLARTLTELGDDAQARQLYEEALRSHEELLGPDHPSTNTTRGNLAVVLLDLGEDEAALREAARTVEASGDRIRLLLGESSEFESLLYSTVHQEYLEVFLCAAARRSSEAAPIDVYPALLDWKGRVYRSQARARARLLGSCTEEQRQKVARLRSTQAALSNLASISEVKDREEHDRNLERLRKERTSLESELIAGVGAISPPVRSSAAVASAIPEGAVLLDFCVLCHYRPAERAEGARVKRGEWSPERLGVWLLRTGDERARWLDLGESAAIESAVSGHLAAIGGAIADPVAGRGVVLAPAGAGDPEPAEAPSDRLHRLLWQPLEALVGDASLVLVCPDRYLATLPFESIRGPGDRHLVEDRSFAYLESAAALVDREARAVPAGDEGPSLLVAGALDYDDGAAVDAGAEIAAADLRGHFDHEWPRLVETGREAEAIARAHEERFPDGRRVVLRALEGTEERLKREIPRHAIVHLATHGYFEPTELPSIRQGQRRTDGAAPAPSREERLVSGYLPGFLSGLVCSGASRPGALDRENGLLTAEEVAWLELGGCDLVVLSACQTALGTSRSGEGLMSLRRSFGQAGARTVIASLWKVEDDATRSLMTDFYRRLWRGEGKLAALRGAQLDAIRRNREERGEAAPHSWGAFVLSGDWR